MWYDKLAAIDGAREFISLIKQLKFHTYFAVIIFFIYQPSYNKSLFFYIPVLGT
jgi:hypothetical protein